MKFSLLCTATLLLVAATLAAAETLDLTKYREASEKKWAKDMAAFDELNATEKHPADSILFVGSSSIRIWETIAADIAPYHPIHRGFGGSRWSDLAVFADRLITPHQFRAVVFFVGNDIKGGGDRTPEEVADLFSYLHSRVRAHNPDAAIFYIAVTPTRKRWAVWPETKAANTAAREVCRREENTCFTGTEHLFIDGEGNPRTELFKEDELHLNEQGYLRWATSIKSHLDTALGGAK